MVLKQKKSLVLLIIYLALTSFLFFDANKKINTPLSPFFVDTNVKYRVEISLAYDPNVYGHPIARAFHNKVLSYAENFVLSIYRSVDPVYIFSLSKKSSSMFDDPGKIQMLYPIEFPFFIGSII